MLEWIHSLALSDSWVGIQVCGIAVLSVLWTEVIRDIRHWLAHVKPRWFPKHQLHHRVFRQDLSVSDPDLYFQAHWHHDVPEAITMLVGSLLLTLGLWWVAPLSGLGSAIGILYSGGFLITGWSRAHGWLMATDLTHKAGPFTEVPGQWWVNRTYHWRHHFDDPNAYFCGMVTLVDQIMGTCVSLKGKTVAITGASGTMGQALAVALLKAGAKVIPISSQSQPIILDQEGTSVSLDPVTWSVGQEADLATLFESIDILILNHGINVHSDRTPEAIKDSYEVNAFSSWRLMEYFFKTVQTNEHMACKEVWVNTSEAEVMPAVSPLYELSKRTLGDLVTLRRLDAPCVIRKLILGPFKSNLNPIGIMSASWVARQIVAQVKRDRRNVVVAISPLTYLLVPLKESLTSTYFKLFSRAEVQPTLESTVT